MESTSATVSPKVGHSLLALLVASVVVAALPAGGRAGPEPVAALKATADADTYVSASSPTRAYGAASSLRVEGTRRRSYVRFSVAGVTGTVIKATLRLYVLDGSRRGVDLRFVQDHSWDEAKLTYANAPAAAPSVTASSGGLASGTWLSLDVTPLVHGGGAYAFVLTNGSSSDLEFAARERGLATAPQLVVEQVLTSTPPSRPGNLGATSITKTGASISWSAPTPSGGVSYDVYRDGTKLGTTSGTSFELTGLACATTYTVTVTARDAAGTVSEPATLTFATSACAAEPIARDTAPPLAPTSPLVTDATRTTLTLAWAAATDDVGVAGYELYQGGVAVGRTTATTYAFTGLSCSTSYTLGVRAYDAAGNRSEALTVVAATATCPDTTPPTPPSMITTSSTTETTISLGWGASLDDTGVSGYGLYRGGALVGTAPLATYTFSGLECGTSYTLGVDAYDASGNRSAVVTVTAATSPCPDRQAPAVSMTYPTSGAVVPSSTAPACAIPTATCVRLNVSASDSFGVTAVRYYVDGAEVAADLTCCDWSEDWDTAAVADGQHQVTAKAWDAAGNVGTSATVTFTVQKAAVPPPPPPPPPPPAPAPSGPTYYVSSSAGSDTNSGLSASTPWRTLAKVNAAPLNPGDTVLFKAGDTWSGVLNITRSGSSSARITLDAYGSGVAPVFTGAPGNRCVELRGAHLTFRNLRVDSCTFGLAIFGNDALVERASLTNNAQGLRVEPGSLRARVVFSDFRDNNKMVVNTSGGNDDYGAMGMIVWGDDVEAHHNTFSGHFAASFDYGRDGAAIEIYGGQRGHYHHNLALDNNTFTELGHARSADNTYSYNVVRATIASAYFLVTRGGGTFGPVYRTFAYNNSVYLTGPTSSGVSCSYCAANVLKLRNNAIKVTGGYALTGADEDYNILAGAYLNGTLGAHSRRSDPLFLSASDLRLQTASPAIDAGIGVGALVDFDGGPVPLGLAPDIGAYERAR